MTERAIVAISDIGLVGRTDAGLQASSPAYAYTGGERLILGEAARLHTWQSPHQSYSDFWSSPGLEPLIQPHAMARNSMDLAYAHLHAVWSELGQPAELWLAVASHQSIEFLGALRGLVAALGVRCLGLIDYSTLCAAYSSVSGEILHLDIHRREMVLTRVQRGEYTERQSIVHLPGLGLQQLHKDLIKLLAQLFVTEHRYDPLYDGRSEQQLYNSLPVTLAGLLDKGSAEVVLSRGAEAITVQLSLQQWQNLQTPGMQRMKKAVEQLEFGQAIVTERWAALPGIGQYLSDVIALETETVLQAALAGNSLPVGDGSVFSARLD
ncbi:MAG: hypothetical protein V7711_13585 [Pseudomonadales bacterium]